MTHLSATRHKRVKGCFYYTTGTLLPYGSFVLLRVGLLPPVKDQIVPFHRYILIELFILAS